MYGHTISIAHNLFQNSSFAGVCSHYGHTYLHLCQFWILGPHPAKSLFGFLHCEIKNQNWRRPIRWPIKTYQSELPVKRKRPKKQNITQTMHINDVFAKNSKMRRKTVLQWNKFVFKWGTRTKFNYWSLNIFLTSSCLFNSRITKTLLGPFWNLKHHKKHRTYCLTMRFFNDVSNNCKTSCKWCISHDASHTPICGRNINLIERQGIFISAALLDGLRIIPVGCMRANVARAQGV